MRSFSRGTIVLLCVGALATASCGGDGGPDNTLYPGQTDFVNNEPSNDDTRGGYPGMMGAEGDASNSKMAPPAPAAPGAPQGRVGEVEEADIYKLDGNKLFYLNTYRGFMVFDMQDPKKPALVSRLPVYGYPIEMFVQKNTVYALLRDVLYLTQVKGKLQFKRHNTSQLVAIDISDLKNPKVLQTTDIIGQLREGVSRKIDNTIYVVSYRDRNYYYDWNYYGSQTQQKEQAWVYSFNVADPKNLQLVDQLKVFEGGSYNYHDQNYNASASRYFQDVTISATSNALMVAESWQTYGYVHGSKWNCGVSTSQQQAIVSVVDISDPQGKIRLHTKFETAGDISDQFKMTYVFDEQTKTGTFFGIVARREWASSGCQGTSLIQNTLESWDISDGGAPKKISEVSFGKPNETVRGSTFDAARGVAFAITARNIDPLYAIDIKDPKNVKIASAVDGLSGDMTVFRFIGDKKFLIGIGRDTSSTCTGFGDPTTGWNSTNIAVSIIDVQDIAKIRLVQRKCVAVKNAGWVSSALTWNLDQAHKMIGMHSDGTVNAITVPVYYYKKSSEDDWWWYNYETAVGLMTWDLTKYDPAKSELGQTVLENYGTIIHPKGEVKRSIVFTHQGTTPRRMVLNLSSTHLSLVDIQDLNAPTTQAIVEVAPFYNQLFRFTTPAGDYLVEHVRPSAYSYYEYSGSNNQNASEFRVKLAQSKLEDQPALATFSVGQVERVVKFKDNLVLFRRWFTKDQSKTSGYYGNWETEILIYSLANPAKPVKLGAVKLPAQVMPYYWYWCGGGAYWGGYWFDSYNSNNWTVTDQGLAFLASTYDYQSHTYSGKLVVADLTNLAAPVVKEHPLPTTSSWSYFSLVPDTLDGSAFYLTYRTKVGETLIDGTTFAQFKYFAQRWAWGGSSFVPEFAINVPGRLMRTWSMNGQKMLLTHDYTYKKVTQGTGTSNYKYWQSSFRLNLMREVKPWGANVAELLDFHNFASFHLKDVVADGNKLFVNARRDYYYNQANQIPWEEVSDYLMIFDVSNLKLAQAYSEPTGTSAVQLMGVNKGKLFVSLPGDGVLVVDTTNVAQPVGLQFLRTLGYTTHIEFVESASNPQGGTAFLASGYFGIYEMNLAGVPAIPTL